MLDIIHFGDIHVWRLEVPWRDLFYPKRYLGTTNLLLNRRKKFPPPLGEAVISDILRQDADLLVFSGDLTTQSLQSEYAACTELFAPLHEKWGDRLFVIPGNHDRYSPRSVKAGWYEHYFPYAKMIQGMRTQVLDDRYAVIGFDASRPFMFRSNGLLSDELTGSLRKALAHQREAGRQVILVGHFPSAYPDDVPIKWSHKLLGRQKLIELIEEFEPAVYMHGHKHQRWRIDNQVNCGAAGMTSSSPSKHAGYVKVRLGESGIDSAQGFALREDMSGCDGFEL